MKKRSSFYDIFWLMLTYFRASSLLLLLFILAACTEPPTPPACEGDNCPKLCETKKVAEPIYRYTDATYGREPRSAFEAESQFNDCYTPSEKVSSTFSFQLNKPELELTQAVLRFDIVNTQGVSLLRDNPLINTDSLVLTPNLREPRTFFSKQNMLDGITVTGSFTFASGAPAGDYRIVVSVVPTRGNEVPGDTVPPIVAFNYAFRIER